MPRSLALRGAELLCVPVNWPVVERPPAGEHPPEQLTAMSAARVNRVFIAVCDRVGAERGVEWVGGTAVIDENGWIVGASSADIDLARARDKVFAGLVGRLRRPAPGALRRGHGRARSGRTQHRGGGDGEPAVRRDVIGAVPALVVSRPVAAPCRGGALAKFAEVNKARAPPRSRQLDRAMLFEKGQNDEIRARSPTVSVARTLTVSLHPVARASSPVNGPPEPRATTNRSPSSVLAVRVPRRPRSLSAPDTLTAPRPHTVASPRATSLCARACGGSRRGGSGGGDRRRDRAFRARAGGRRRARRGGAAARRRRAGVERGARGGR